MFADVTGKWVQFPKFEQACYDDPKERSHALGPIFRTVFWHSLAGAAVIGVIAMLQAYVFTGMIPVPPLAK